jgi:tetratricopeptide (TPR) repeat protein
MQDINSLTLVQAWQAINNGDAKEALILLEVELAKNSENKVVLYSIGLAYRMLNKFDDAERFYLKAIESNDRSTISFPNLKGYNDFQPLPDVIFCQIGIICQLKKEYQKAITAFEKAIGINKFYANAYNSLAITYRKMGDLDKALKIYNAGKKALIESAHNEALKDKEKCYQDKFTADGKRIMEIQPYYTEKVHEILKDNEDYSVLCTNEARIYSEIGKFEEAEELLKEAIEFLPNESDYKVPFEAIERVQKLKNGRS